MCRFKSGVIFKNKVVLAPMYNDSHSSLLEMLGVEDSRSNAMRRFVRAELVPHNNVLDDVDSWKFIVDQDIVPEWFEEDPKRYEQEFRNAVREFVKDKFVLMAGVIWVKIKENNIGSYYLKYDELTRMEFGSSNDYRESDARNYLKSCDLAKKLKEELGDRLVPITTELLSLDGLDDYGKVDGDFLSLLTLDLYRECRKNIPNLGNWWWLANPYSTKSNGYSRIVCCVSSRGAVGWNDCGCSLGVRPFCIVSSSISVS